MFREQNKLGPMQNHKAVESVSRGSHFKTYQELSELKEICSKAGKLKYER